ncbi:Flagellar biosynthetic protein FliP precursor [Stieleria bergensis]|uniref:Flagellar biosynthetic protein FliP n=1 Tax=Stieleria bergensis TaxID=2528025 RepID=A0A517SSY3_9BACT|nr:MAG: flagellar biosynthetic protein FliP [Rhodopirellula sp. TMED11]QDT59203.1 Flagellar biosynthetic protein FliP precursor [Planctomycetes bacterium SV_7m_r]
MAFVNAPSLLLLADAASSTVQETSETLRQASDVFDDLAGPIQVALFLGALSFTTAILVSATAFTRIVIVMSFVRRALSTQEIPPNQVMLGLSLFLTFFIMAPTFDRIHDRAIKPFLEAKATESEEEPLKFEFVKAAEIATSELKTFMLYNTRRADLQLFYELADTPPPSQREATPLKIAVPAFIISELKTAFIMGFCIYIPFMLIDLVISTILMALGMMMMPPVVVSTPCKLLLFVMVDGWQLISRALVASFA